MTPLSHDPLSHVFHSAEVAMWGTAGAGAVGIIAQAASSAPVDWLNLTALAALILIAMFLVTKFLPGIQKATAEAQIENNKTMTEMHNRYCETIANMQLEHSTVLKSIVMDNKELMASTIKGLVEEKRQQRESLLAHFDNQMQRVAGEWPARISGNKQGDGS